jgi:hypothetical protein
MKTSFILNIFVMAIFVAIPFFIITQSTDRSLDKQSTSNVSHQKNDKRPSVEQRNDSEIFADTNNQPKQPVVELKKESDAVQIKKKSDTLELKIAPETKEQVAGSMTTSGIDEKLAAILAQTEGQLVVLRGRCAGTLSGLFQKFKSTTDKQQRAQFVDQGFAALGSCDGQFAGIVGQMASQMQAIGVNAAQYEAQYRAAYQATKQAAMSSLSN